MLTRIHIDNYKCLTNFDLRLDNLTLLVGANGCGKSAIFEVMDKLRDFARDMRVEKLFLADELTRWTTKREQCFELELSTDGGAFAYELDIEPGSPGDSADIPHTLFLDEPDNYVTLPELQPWLTELADGAGDTLPQVVLISHHPEAIDFLAHNTVWLAREPESHTRVVEPRNDTGLRMSEVYARGWSP